jgi:hypothetical protein
MKLIIKRFVGEVGYLMPLNGRVDHVVAAVAESVFSEDVVYSSLDKTVGRRPRLRLRCIPIVIGQFSLYILADRMEGLDEFTITITPVQSKDFKSFYRSIISVFEREMWPLEADDE